MNRTAILLLVKLSSWYYSSQYVPITNTQEYLNNIRDLSDIDRLDIDIGTSIPNRHNEDQTVNTFGKELISTIEEARMIILNGRTLGDWQGAKTCYTYNGSSTVDYMIVSQGLFNNVATFRILEPEWFTDHCPMACYLKLRKPWNEYKKETNLTPITRYIYGQRTVQIKLPKPWQTVR